MCFCCKTCNGRTLLLAFLTIISPIPCITATFIGSSALCVVRVFVEQSVSGGVVVYSFKAGRF